MISILCPSRGRPAKCLRMIESVKNTAENAEIHVAVLEEERIKYEEFLGRNIEVVPEWSTVMTWNYLAGKAQGDLIMLGSDDTVFTTPGWDSALIEHYNSLDNKIHVYSLRDSRDRAGTPHPIVTKEFIAAMGYFLPPIFLHWFVDTWIVDIAKANNCFTHLTDYLLVHDKPSDSGDPDETHNRIRRQGWHRRDQYVNDTCQHFLGHERIRLGRGL